MTLTRKGWAAIAVMAFIVSVLTLVWLHRSGRLVNYGFWVAVSQLLLLLLGILTALFNEWVQKHRLLTLAIFTLVGVAGFVVTIKQSDQSAGEAKELVAKLDRIEASVSQPNPDKNQILAEIRAAREAVTSQQKSDTSLPVRLATINPVQETTPNANLVDDRRQRKITDKQRAAMIAILEKAPANLKQLPQMKILQLSLENESARYASDMVSVISAAGWNVRQPENFYPFPNYYSRSGAGITILVNKQEPLSPLVKTLSDALKAAGIPHVIDTGQMYADQTEIVLIIGTKRPGDP